MRRIVFFIALLAAVPLFPADEVQCLLSFAVDEKSPRGGSGSGDGKLPYREIRWYGRTARIGHLANHYLVRFEFPNPVSPVAAASDAGTPWVRIDSRSLVQAPSNGQDFKAAPGTGRVIDVLVPGKPGLVKLLVSGKGGESSTADRTNRRYDQRVRDERRMAEPSNLVIARFRKAYQDKKTDDLSAYFGKRRVFLKEYVDKKRVFRHLDAAGGLAELALQFSTASGMQARGGYGSIKLEFTFADRSKATWTIEKDYNSWRVATVEKTMPLPKDFNRYRRRY